jgi:antitoxin PrlF
MRRHVTEDPGMTTSTLNRRGQTTIPKEIREHLGLEPGDEIRFVIDAHGRVHLVARNRRLADLAGCLGRPERHVSLEEMDEAVAEEAVARFLRATREP